MSNLSIAQATTLATVLGLAGSAALFFTVPLYHNFIVWQWTNFDWLFLPSVAVGVAIAVLTD
jgi:hypothetical protein